MDQSLFNLFLLCLFISPWPLGANRDWAWPLILVVFSVIAIALLVRDRLVFTDPVRLLLGAFGMLTLWMLVQLYGVPLLVAPVSIDDYSTFSDLLKTLGYLAFSICILGLVKQRRQIEMIIYVVVLAALIQSLLGGFQVFVLDRPVASGSFPNRNHYGSYLGLAVALGTGLMIARMKTAVSGRWLENLIDLVTGPQARMRIMLVLIVIGLVLSRSRGGNMAMLGAIVASGLILYFFTRSISKKTLLLLMSILVLDVALIGSYFGVDKVAERIQNTTMAAESRDELNWIGLKMVSDHRFTGTGAGTYEYAFSQYRDAEISARVTNAENEYIEFLVELGIFGVVPLIAILVLGIRTQLVRVRSDQEQYGRGIAFGCLLGTLMVLLHGSVEFILQIPAIALLFVLFLVLPMARLEDGALTVR